MDEESDGGEASVSSKKRGRKSQPTGSEEVEITETRVSKKARTDTTRKNQENDVAIQDEEEEVIIGDMVKYISVPSWEELVKSIDTIEKDESGKIMVYFTLCGIHVVLSILRN